MHCNGLENNEMRPESHTEHGDGDQNEEYNFSLGGKFNNNNNNNLNVNEYQIYTYRTLYRKCLFNSATFSQKFDLIQ